MTNFLRYGIYHTLKFYAKKIADFVLSHLNLNVEEAQELLETETQEEFLEGIIAQLNKIRKENVALQRLRNLHFHHTDSGAILAYSKREGNNLILVVVNLDPTYVQETTVHWNMHALGINQEHFKVTDLLDESVHHWSAHTFVRLQPSRPVGKVAHIVKVEL